MSLGQSARNGNVRSSTRNHFQCGTEIVQPMFQGGGVVVTSIVGDNHREFVRLALRRRDGANDSDWIDGCGWSTRSNSLATSFSPSPNSIPTSGYEQTKPTA